MVTRVIFILLIFSSSLFAECTDYSLNENKKIKDIEINIYESRKFFKKLSRVYLERLTIKSSKKINKKKYKAKIKINYIDKSYCIYDSTIRAHGDGHDHVDLINGVPMPSLRVKLKEGNINQITRFILFRPKSRLFENEIFTTTLFSHLNFLSPRTFAIKVKINGVKADYIFQEGLKKEFLEYNKKIEGPILESNEDWENYSTHQMSRISNKEWIKNDLNKFVLSLNAINDYNISLLTSYKFRVGKNEDETLRFKESNFSIEEYTKINMFDALAFGVGAGHGLSYDDRRFYFDTVYSELIPIYYDGMVNILSTIKYDPTDGKFDNIIFQDSKVIEKPFLNYHLNHERTHKQRYRNQAVTKSAKKGANLMIQKLKTVDKSKLLEELHINGFNKISIKQLDIVMEKIIERLNLIAEAKVYEKSIDLESSVYMKYAKEMKLDNDLDLIFINNNQKFSDNKTISIERCNYKLDSCQHKQANKNNILDLFEQNNIDKKRSIFIGMDKMEYKNGLLSKSKNNIKESFRKIEIFKSMKFYLNDYVSLDVDQENKIIDLNYKNEFGRAIIYKSNIDSWTIRMNNLTKQKNEKFENFYNLTGCLTIIDTFLKSVNISGENFNCEDTINLIRTTGSVDKIVIKNSKSDALDADFSDLFFKEIFIINSLNDCIDFSFGKYAIQNSNLSKCKDKAVSVGEKSSLEIKSIKIKDSDLGIVSKDGSKVFIDSANMQNTGTCLSSYKKKQEFNGGTISFKELICDKNAISFDEYSKIIKLN